MVAHSSHLYSAIPVAIRNYVTLFWNTWRDSEVLVEIPKYRIYVEFSCTSESRKVFQNCDKYFRIVKGISQYGWPLCAAKPTLARLRFIADRSPYSENTVYICLGRRGCHQGQWQLWNIRIGLLSDASIAVK